MGLKDRLKEPVTKAPHKTCAVCWALHVTTGDDLEALEVMIADPSTYRGDEMSQIVTDELQIDCNPQAVYRHRRGLCKGIRE